MGLGTPPLQHPGEQLAREQLAVELCWSVPARVQAALLSAHLTSTENPGALRPFPSWTESTQKSVCQTMYEQTHNY